jgi:hypothetical protein
MGDVNYRCHRIRFTRSPLYWFAYVYPPSGRRALDQVPRATIAEGADEALNRARALVDSLDRSADRAF